MIARLAFRAGLGLVAVVAVFAQLDRASRLDPALAASVPAPFRGFATQVLARQAIAGGDGGAAVAEARALVATRPIPAEHLVTLFSASLLAGDQSRALEALEAAAGRGWREPLSQLASGRAALEQGQVDIASRRAVALLATGHLPDASRALVADLLATPAGREALGERLLERGYWHRGLLAQAGEAKGELLAIATKKAAALPCDQLREIGNAASRDDPDIAAIRSARCGR